jgi:hypothetical protein
MKIATWNVERLKRLRKLDEIIAVCNAVDADIFVLNLITPGLNFFSKYVLKIDSL